ncbi:MAG TPA: DUF1501 domain-containing protein [Pirellulales bacterium]|jgi:hypothetical protein|nr:DUF1501 domain-containing protein [Pirellulales bacterium]
MFLNPIIAAPHVGAVPQSISRRGFMRRGAVAIGGIALVNLLRQEALAAGSGSAAAEKRSVILLFQQGGPSHLETWDMKPNAPIEYRGEFKGISTSIPGYQVGEYMPRLAKLCHKLAILRSVYHDSTEHSQGVHTVLTGYKPTKNAPGNEFPSVGSIVAKELGPRANGMPPYIATMTAIDSSNAAYLGVEYNPFQTFGYPQSSGFRVRNMALPDGVDSSRLARRQSMLRRFDDFRREADASGALAGMDNFSRRAMELVGSPEIRQAFDLNKEPAALRERYGAQSSTAQSMLLARRLVEAGARFVTVRVEGAWDSHKDNFTAHRALLPPWDQSLATLIEDLDSRGMLDTTLLIIGGEFGRTPKINKDAGRDHWPMVYSTVLCGGGLKQGIVLGESDALAESPRVRPISVQDVLATVYHQLGINTHKTFCNEAHRPVEILNYGSPIQEIL